MNVFFSFVVNHRPDSDWTFFHCGLSCAAVTAAQTPTLSRRTTELRRRIERFQNEASLRKVKAAHQHGCTERLKNVGVAWKKRKKKKKKKSPHLSVLWQWNIFSEAELFFSCFPMWAAETCTHLELKTRAHTPHTWLWFFRLSIEFVLDYCHCALSRLAYRKKSQALTRPFFFFSSFVITFCRAARGPAHLRSLKSALRLFARWIMGHACS